ncbi:alternate F1F0 ATPase, F1 subunit alpha [uncultured Anaeromusa sp.]|uniref:alternate F1F0 ATPase, F1 subunit alpha n=1 Tax=uncultured Anaeromusa sp. TaxID=673273 RepID=UPI0029C7DF24|nr:alternate F1F0 ATPase, F1 subunit alpha [uncultured Anaeromusa sp.]
MSQNRSLLLALEKSISEFERVRETYQPVLTLEQVGCVRSFGNGIAWVTGLASVEMEELVLFPGEVRGIVLDIGEEQVGVILLDQSASLAAGAEVRRTGRVADVPVGEGLLGRVIDPGGRPLDNQGPLQEQRRFPIEREAPAILQRQPVKVPLQTGMKVIDALIPIGRGQRQLIIGDRQTGKTTIAIDTIINQRDSHVICVYCAIGQRGASLAKVIDELVKADALAYTVVVVAEGGAPPGVRYIAPYAATAIGEYFMEQGKDVLVVYDDLTNHANTYREISLLLRRPPGREAFPGDIFYIHSRMLERATRLKEEYGGGSLTALPILQTEAQNLAAYIPTNLISITDGQLYLSPELFRKGLLPAVDIGKSVSRVGGKAQLAAYRTIAGALKLAYSQFEELEMFSRFGTKLDEHTLNTLAYGERIRMCLLQGKNECLQVHEQIAVLVALTAQVFGAIPLAVMPEAQQRVIAAAAQMEPALCEKIYAGKSLNESEYESFLLLLRNEVASLEVHDGAVNGGLTP